MVNNNQQTAAKQELENNMIKTDQKRHNQRLGSNNPFYKFTSCKGEFLKVAALLLGEEISLQKHHRVWRTCYSSASECFAFC
jgi:hypothetical protein